MSIRVEGMDKVLINLAKEIKAIKFRTKKGMISAGLHVQRAAQLRTPRDLGNLINSAFTVWGGSGGSTSAAKSFKSGGSSSAGDMSTEHSRVVAGEKAELSASEFAAPEVTVGFSAAYALYVHEDLEASHTKRNKKGGTTQIGEAKFLEKALKDSYSNIIALIAAEGKK